MQTRFANNWLGSKISPANRLDRPLAVAASSVPPCGLCGPPGGQITTSEALEWAYARQFMLGERLDPSSSYRAMRHALSRLTCGLAGCRDKFRHHRGFRGRVCMLAHRVGGRSALTNLINLKKLEPSPSHARLAQDEEPGGAGGEARGRGRLGETRTEMTTTRTHFTFRVDTWTPDGDSIVEHVAGVEDYQVALATFHAACERWPGTPITLRQGARVIEDSRRLRMV